MSSNWDLDAVVSFFREDPVIHYAISESEFRALLNPNVEFLALVRNALAYQEFDPKVVIRQVIRNRKAYEAKKNPRQEWDLSNTAGVFATMDGSDEANIFSNEEAISKDMDFLIWMFLARNNHISKIVKKSNILEMLKEKYNINDKTRKSTPSDITLPRLAKVFPTIAVRLFHDKVVKEIVPFSSIPSTNDGMTHALCCPFLPSLHPKALNEDQNIHGIMVYVAVKLDAIIHKKEKGFTSLDNLISYYKASFESAVTPEASRIQVFRKIGLLGAVDLKLPVDILAANAACLRALSSMRTNDADHERLMKVAGGDLS